MNRRNDAAASDVTALLVGAVSDHTPRGIAAAVRKLITAETLRPMARLPTVRSLAGELHVSASTVSEAWRILAREGMIRSAGRNGTVVLRAREVDVSARLERSTWIVGRHGVDLSSGTPDSSLLPSIAAALSDVEVAGIDHYQVTSILPELEEVIREAWRGVVGPDRVTMTHGAYAGVSDTLRAILRPGDRVLVENPSVPAVIDLVEMLGAVAVPVTLDENGINTRSLAAGLLTRPSVLILQPRGQNPTGISMTWDRAEELAALLGATRTLVIEDDHSGAVSISEQTSLARWIPDQVVTIQSFSKSHGPDLRLAAMGAPRDILRRIELARRLAGGWESMLLQRVLLQLLTDPASIHAISHARRTYKWRRRLLADECHRRGLETSGVDGLNLWVSVDHEHAAMARLASADIGVCPGSSLMWDSPDSHHLRITTARLSDAEAPHVAALLSDTPVSRGTAWRAARSG